MGVRSEWGVEALTFSDFFFDPFPASVCEGVHCLQKETILYQVTKQPDDVFPMILHIIYINWPGNYWEMSPGLFVGKHSCFVFQSVKISHKIIKFKTLKSETFIANSPFLVFAVAGLCFLKI